MIVHPIGTSEPRVHPRGATSARHAALPSLQDIRVLAVDDEADALTLVSEVLQAAGARVSTASSVDDALKILDTEQLDVLVADLGMPQVDGFNSLIASGGIGRAACVRCQPQR